MNAYERRKYAHEATKRKNNAKRTLERQLKKAEAEKFYEDAFVSLQGKRPSVIPRMSAENLIKAAHLMYARLHEQELADGIPSSDR